MTAKEMFNELTWISDSWDGEHISFDKDRLEGYLQELETKLQNTSSSSEYIKKPSALEYRRICTKEKINPIVADLIYHLFFI